MYHCGREIGRNVRSDHAIFSGLPKFPASIAVISFGIDEISSSEHTFIKRP